MRRTSPPTDAIRLETAVYPVVQVFVPPSDDGFYKSLQRIWDNVIQLEDMGIIQQENDKFIYAHRYAELELKRAFLEQTSIGVDR